jgi:sporulation integral membrane protein YlbJ
MNRKTGIILLGMIVVLFVLFPNVICQGAKNGLVLWFDTVLPALLPFMILSDFMIRQQITESVSRLAYPFFSKMFGLTRAGCYPAVIGLLSGYPLGAKTTAQLYQKQMVSREEAQYLLTFCNNASPMFLLEYIGIHCMGLKHPAVLLVVIYLSAYAGSLLSRQKHFSVGKCAEPVCKGQTQTIVASLDESILDAFVTITKVGGYIILFSILAQVLLELLPAMSFVKYIGIGVLEITTGSAVLSQAKLAAWVRNSIIAGLCAYGGLSSVAQTASVLEQTDLSVGKYVLSKLFQAVCAAGLFAVCSLFL